MSVYNWCKFSVCGSIYKGKSSDRRLLTETKVDEILAAFICSPGKSVRQAVVQLSIPNRTVNKIL
jgi:hypothetical protein